MKICWTQGLYDAIIYIYNHGMKDYVSPFEELMTELQSALAAGNFRLKLVLNLLVDLNIHFNCDVMFYFCLRKSADGHSNIIRKQNSCVYIVLLGWEGIPIRRHSIRHG
jgi:hypothetical protein